MSNTAYGTAIAKIKAKQGLSTEEIREWTSLFKKILGNIGSDLIECRIDEADDLKDVLIAALRRDYSGPGAFYHNKRSQLQPGDIMLAETQLGKEPGAFKVVVNLTVDRINVYYYNADSGNLRALRADIA